MERELTKVSEEIGLALNGFEKNFLREVLDNHELLGEFVPESFHGVIYTDKSKVKAYEKAFYKHFNEKFKKDFIKLAKDSKAIRVVDLSDQKIEGIDRAKIERKGETLTLVTGANIMNTDVPTSSWRFQAIQVD